MLRTFVCEKEGCSGNSFFIESFEENLNLVRDKQRYASGSSKYTLIRRSPNEGTH